MNKPTAIFVTTIVLFATGTSAIGYSLASDSFNANKAKQTYTTVVAKPAPWYCIPPAGKIKGQFVDEKSGYNQPGYYNPGYTAPGYTAPGYRVPGYTAPTYTTPGYKAEPISARPTSLLTLPPKLGANGFTVGWQKALEPCPKGYAFDVALVVSKCSIALQKKLDGNPLPAESKEQYYTCEKVIAANVWNAKISQKICNAFYLYESDCATSQRNKKACSPLSRYLSGVGVAKDAIPKTQSDAIYLCKDVYPKS